MISVALVDDHPVARRGIQSILDDTEDIRVVLQAASPEQLAERWNAISGCGDSSAGLPVDSAGGSAGGSARETGAGGVVDVVLLDLYGVDGRPCLPVIAEWTAITRILVLSASAGPDDVLGAIQHGASGYITKLAEPELIVSAVRTVAGGGFAVSAELADILLNALAPTTPGSPVAATTPSKAGEPARTSAGKGTAVLSPREEQALDFIARGFTHAQTATRMGVSKATVDTYVERIRAKLQVGNKAELTRAALLRRIQPS